ncbi:YkvA family protein [Spiribacter vilamensis]|uniref:Uncharacterized membrane protein YkvA (DUF1232 family) n=1 Tax=Spiribacter vilamensis TaxID=531306 RepID=A0A4V2GJ03_9GAMM|nr:YkvA family protein [Spiribacter vilamensis]RZU98415.1 uncharacterized membrane protein YkvA (DUF1232 family) [Spiribacter vilamensis]TVO60708.1 DUF1232 domain-containing protein [Spiribacter vilamensis]
MTISSDEERKAREQFETHTDNVDGERVGYASRKGRRKVEGFGGKPPSRIQSLWRDINLMIGLASDYSRGNYTQIPWNVLAAVTGAILYFVSPVDVVPDFIPVIGYVDDALVIKLALEIARPDLEAYAEWKSA